MKKIAIFVEGMTEQEFVIAMVTSIVGSKGLEFILAEQFGGKVTINHNSPDGDTRFYVLVVDCRTDNQVKTQIREQYNSLVAAGYTSIIGLRDVFPLSKAEIPQLTRFLSAGLPQGNVPASLHLAVMEVETWFIAELSHFEKICPSLTYQRRLEGGFDTSKDPELWAHPADVLHQIYRLASKSYTCPNGRKKKKRVQRTLRALSFEEMYVNVRAKLPSLNGFVEDIENALF